MVSSHAQMTLKLDEELVLLAKDGNKTAFAELVRRHEREVYGLLCIMTSNSEDARDCSQDVFMKAWQKIATLQCSTSFPSWVRTIAKRRGYDFWRARKAPCMSWENVREDALIDYMYNPETIVIENELVRKTLAELPEKYRFCLLLQLVCGLSHSEIARIVGMHANSVSTYVCEAKKRFYQIYQRLSNDYTYPLEEIDDA